MVNSNLHTYVRSERSAVSFDFNSMYRDFFHVSPEMILISSPDMRILDINRSGLMLLGYDSKEEFLSLLKMGKIYPASSLRLIRLHARSRIQKEGYLPM